MYELKAKKQMHLGRQRCQLHSDKAHLNDRLESIKVRAWSLCSIGVGRIWRGASWRLSRIGRALVGPKIRAKVSWTTFTWRKFDTKVAPIYQ